MRGAGNRRGTAFVIGGVAALAAGGGAAAAMAGGLGATSATTGSTGPMAFVSTTTSATQPLPAASAVDQAAAAMATADVVSSQATVPSDIVSAQAGSPPADAQPLPGSPALPALYITVKIPSLENGEAVEPLWEADLLEGAAVELAGSSASLEADVGYIYFDGKLPHGTVIPDIGGGMGDIARGQQFAGSQDSDLTIEDSIDSTVAAYGLTLDNLTIYHVLGTAPAVIVTEPDITKIASSYGSLVDDLFGSPPRYQGYYLEIRGPDGSPYIRRSVSFVTGAGRLWRDPSMDGAG